MSKHVVKLSVGLWVVLLATAFVLAACDDGPSKDEIFIAQTCSQRMTLAADHHDSLSVLLACDQLRMTARMQQDADERVQSAQMSGVAAGVAAGASFHR